MTRRRTLTVALLIIALLGAVLLFWPPATRLYALDPASGRVRWIAPIAGPVLPYSARVTLTPQLVLLWGTTAENRPAPPRLQAFDAASGQLRWTWTPEPTLYLADQQPVTPLAVGDAVYLLTAPARDAAGDPVTLFRIDARSGALVWQQPVPGAALGVGRSVAFAAGPDTVVVGYGAPGPNNGGTLRGFDGSSGQQRWEVQREPTQPDGDGIPFDAVISGQTLSVRGLDALDQYNLSTGQLITSLPIARRAIRPYSAAGAAFVTEDPAGLVALDGTSVRWRTPVTLAPNQQTRALLANAEAAALSLLTGAEQAAEFTTSTIVFDITSGTERWRGSGRTLADEALGAGALIQRDYGDRPAVQSRALRDGARQWRFALRESGAVVAADDQLVVLTDRAPFWLDWLTWLSPGLRG